MKIRPGKWSAEYETDKVLEYLYDDKNAPWQLHPRVIERNCQDSGVLEFRRRLKE